MTNIRFHDHVHCVCALCSFSYFNFIFILVLSVSLLFKYIFFFNFIFLIFWKFLLSEFKLCSRLFFPSPFILFYFYFFLLIGMLYILCLSFACILIHFRFMAKTTFVLLVFQLPRCCCCSSLVFTSAAFIMCILIRVSVCRSPFSIQF